MDAGPGQRENPPPVVAAKGAVVADANRLEALEFKCAHLEASLQELSDVLYRHQRLLDDLASRQREMLEALSQLDGRSTGAASPVEIPPHY